MRSFSKFMTRQCSCVAATLLFFWFTLLTRAHVGVAEGKRKDVVELMCGSQCYGTDVVTSQRLSKQGWSNVVDTMVSRGATGTDDEIEVVIDYPGRALRPG
jgi:hypothetical protein